MIGDVVLALIDGFDPVALLEKFGVLGLGLLWFARRTKELEVEAKKQRDEQSVKIKELESLVYGSLQGQLSESTKAIERSNTAIERANRRDADVVTTLKEVMGKLKS